MFAGYIGVLRRVIEVSYQSEAPALWQGLMATVGIGGAIMALGLTLLPAGLHAGEDRGPFRLRPGPGALIVDAPEPYPVDRELLWVLDGWRLNRNGEVVADFHDFHDVSHAGRVSNTVTVNGHLPHEQTVRPGERLRLRLLNLVVISSWVIFRDRAKLAWSIRFASAANAWSTTSAVISKFRRNERFSKFCASQAPTAG